jgi:hypothetical protein
MVLKLTLVIFVAIIVCERVDVSPLYFECAALLGRSERLRVKNISCTIDGGPTCGRDFLGVIFCEVQSLFTSRSAALMARRGVCLQLLFPFRACCHVAPSISRFRQCGAAVRGVSCCCGVFVVVHYGLVFYVGNVGSRSLRRVGLSEGLRCLCWCTSDRLCFVWFW